MKNIQQVSKKMCQALNKAADQAAKRSPLITRSGGKVTPRNLLQTLVLTWWQSPSASLESLSQTGELVGLNITAQGLDQWFTKKTAEFLKAALEQVIRLNVVGEQAEIPILQRFTNVYLEDSSTVILPKVLHPIWPGRRHVKEDTTSAVKLQTRLDMLYGKLDGPHLVPDHVHDKKAAEHHSEIEAGSLRVIDLGYWSLDNWDEDESRGHYTLSRLKADAKFLVEDKLWTSWEWIQRLDKGTTEFSIEAKLGNEEKGSVRIFAKKVPDTLAEKRRRRAKRKYRRKTTKRMLDLCAWTILVTNAPVDKIGFEDAFILYRLRWQIELLFKLWKSEMEIDKSRSQNPWRILCELYAKLIGAILKQLIFSVTIWQFADRSWVKAHNLLQSQMPCIALALRSPRKLAHVLEMIKRLLTHHARVNKRSQNPSTSQLLLNLEPLA